jgi:hypothetical protein
MVPLIVGAGMLGAGALGKWLTSKDVAAPGSINMADLQRVNPALFKEIMQNEAKINEAKSILESRRRTATAQELQAVADARNAMQAQQAHMGLAGTSAGAGQQGDMEARMQAQIAERAMAEEQMYQQQLDQARQQAQMSNRMGSEFLWSKAMADYGDQMAKEQQNAQFWNSIMGSGLSMGTQGVGQMIQQPNIDAQADLYRSQSDYYRNAMPNRGVPVASAPMQRGPQRTLASAPSPDYRYRGYNRGNG